MSTEEVDEVDEDLVALPQASTVRLTGLTDRQIGYWNETDLVHPSVDTRLSPQRPVRLYNHQELLSLLVIAELRRRGISLQQVREIVAYLRRQGYRRPLTELRFATDRSRVYFQHSDGEWEGDSRPGQGVIAQVLDLQPLRVLIERAVRRESESVGKVERRRGVMGNKARIAGTRIPVETVRRHLDHGRTIQQIVDSYPILTADDVIAVRDELSA